MKKLLLSILATMLISTNVSAFSLNPNIPDSMIDYMGRNGIYYYNPNGFANNCYHGLGSYDGIASAGLSDLQSSFVDTYHDLAAELGAEYGIPWETVMAQGIVESASGTSAIARDKNNLFGLGAVDSDPYNKALSFSSIIEGWRGYFEFIRTNSRYENAGAFNFAGNPLGYLTAIKSAGYATDENYINTVGAYVRAIENRSSEKGWQSSSEIAAATGRRSSGSISIYNLCSSLAYGNGDINATALALSWADRSHNLHDPKSVYTTALAKIGLNTYPDDFAKIGASCDAFVATVLRYSGADPNVVCCGVSNMRRYFENHPELYEKIPNLGNTSNLQPGDIRISSDHVEMYVIENGTGKIASASHGDRTADHGINYYADSSFAIYRLKRSANYV